MLQMRKQLNTKKPWRKNHKCQFGLDQKNENCGDLEPSPLSPLPPNPPSKKSKPPDSPDLPVPSEFELESPNRLNPIPVKGCEVEGSPKSNSGLGADSFARSIQSNENVKSYAITVEKCA